LQALLVHVKIAHDEHHFNLVLRALLERFQGASGSLLLQKRGTLILRGLCGLLGGTEVFSELATILETETNCTFAASMTQALNLLLLTAPELAGLRMQLQNALHDQEAAQLLQTLYSCWCHSAVAGLSLCMLAQAYAHVDAMIHALAELPLLPVLLAQVDRCVLL
jgi:vacuole morphology and inheritance protein 14